MILHRSCCGLGEVEVSLQMTQFAPRPIDTRHRHVLKRLPCPLLEEQHLCSYRENMTNMCIFVPSIRPKPQYLHS